MSEEKQLTRDMSPLGVRVSDELKQWIKSRAKENRRTMNSEVVFMIEQFKNQHENHA